MRENFSVGGREVRATKLGKPLWPEGYTKADLMAYLLHVAPILLPYLRGRPLSFTRWPDGIGGGGFYQKNAPSGTPPWVPTTRMHDTTYLLVEEEATLAFLANLAVIEIHMPLVRLPNLDHPDLAVIDLDPMPPCGFSETLTVARLVKVALDQLGLVGFLKTSGATGLHIFLPLEPALTARQVTEHIRNFAAALQQSAPDLITLERRVRDRSGVYFDYGQNAPTRTMAAPYSPRPLPGAPVSTPVHWTELGHFEPQDFTIMSVPRRLESLGDPMAAIPKMAQRLDALRRI